MLTDLELVQSPFGEGAVFNVLERWYHRDPPEPLLWEAAGLYESASPAMIQGAARWLGVVQELREGGLDPGKVSRVLLSAACGEPRGWRPSPAVLAKVLESAGGEVDAAHFAADLMQSGDVPMALRPLFTICVALMARAGEPTPQSYDAHLVFHVPWRLLRTVIASLPEARRDAVVVRLLGRPPNPNAARIQLRNVLPILDLATGQGARSSIAAVREQVEGNEKWAHVVAAVDAGGGPPTESQEPTADCRRAVEYWLNKYEQKTSVGATGAVARDAHSKGVQVDAPELASWAEWNAASASRRQAIALEVERAVDGLVLQPDATFDAGSVTSFTHGDTVFRLVPGGKYERGFSDEEEAAVRAAAEAARPAGDNWEEEFGHFLKNTLHSMRPVSEVSIGPMLVCASPGFSMTPDRVPSFLSETPWRLPSEAEWEYAARGGRSRELTWRGNVVPDEAWFTETEAEGEGACNPFGLWGFGMQPELCSDGWHETHEGAPTDGSPRAGEGSVVARGGAAMLYPWQQVGEWQLLCNAVRSPATHWEFEVCVRPVLGISCSVAV